ncbi:uncharacterized protein VDAG_06913 [Verticillium dahliae VdLs.17]|uniref:Involucrin repeat protein n=1 Tax=Verticillium dahliae (strain VdLs.17 / ATCC MYA-4575 / FGSC 10137) TaxID=498257 RepID=G2XA10_VERDV|nr:uncharacterized protein VDAG_06913 [Verticillium dahliae VdLs.17]EGY15749.1 hypothetical protein VDAG_06913 [Verticillium dahliae VdLs.17]
MRTGTQHAESATHGSAPAPMTKERKTNRMSSSADKRRSAGPGSHILRTASTRSAANPVAGSTKDGAVNAGNAVGGGSSSSSSNNNIIAPPPRAQLGVASVAGGSLVPGDEGPKPGDAGCGAATQKERETHGGTSGSGTGTGSSSTKEADGQRIALLETELAVMEDEFARELDRLSRKESETATFWQGRVARAEDRARAACGEMEALEAECVELRAQVRGLKEFVSTSTRTDGQSATSDEVFGEGAARLGNGLQNWVIVHFRRAKIDFGKASEDELEELAALVPMYEELAAAAKVHLLQSLGSFATSRRLCDLTASSEEAVNQWRSTTLTLLRREAGDKMHSETDAATERVIERINRVLDGITDIKTTDARDQALRALIVSAIDLGRLLAVQKAVFGVFMPEIVPHQQTMFDPATMEDVGGEDEETLSQRDICCVTFPGIMKRGDETGRMLAYRNIIAKAMVLCSPE